MTDKDKVIEYELQIEDMLKAIQENLDELTQQKDLSEFEQGRQLAYEEMLDIIKTRHSMILDVLK
jgi:hypothetical protein